MADDAPAFWLVSDWGVSEDAFVARVRFALGAGEVRCVRLGLEEFRTRADLLESVRATHGITFEENCDRVEEQGEAILALADAPVAGHAGLQDARVGDRGPGLRDWTILSTAGSW